MSANVIDCIPEGGPACHEVHFAIGHDARLENVPLKHYLKIAHVFGIGGGNRFSPLPYSRSSLLSLSAGILLLLITFAAAAAAS